MKRFYFSFVFLLIIMINSNAQTLSSREIWDKIFIPKNENWKKDLKNKDFILKYGGPKKQSGFLSCYRQNKSDEWLFISQNEKYEVTGVSYYLPTIKKYQNNFVNKKELLVGEDMQLLGKVLEQGKYYYHTIYTYSPFLPPPNK